MVVPRLPLPVTDRLEIVVLRLLTGQLPALDHPNARQVFLALTIYRGEGLCPLRHSRVLKCLSRLMNDAAA